MGITMRWLSRRRNNAKKVFEEKKKGKIRVKEGQQKVGHGKVFRDKKERNEYYSEGCEMK